MMKGEEHLYATDPTRVRCYWQDLEGGRNWKKLFAGIPAVSRVAIGYIGVLRLEYTGSLSKNRRFDTIAEYRLRW